MQSQISTVVNSLSPSRPARGGVTKSLKAEELRLRPVNNERLSWKGQLQNAAKPNLYNSIQISNNRNQKKQRNLNFQTTKKAMLSPPHQTSSSQIMELNDRSFTNFQNSLNKLIRGMQTGSTGNSVFSPMQNGYASPGKYGHADVSSRSYVIAQKHSPSRNSNLPELEARTSLDRDLDSTKQHKLMASSLISPANLRK